MTQQNVLISGRKTDGIPSAIKTDDNGSLDVYLQDQNTTLYNFYVKRLLNQATLASNTVLNSRTLLLVAGHGFTTGEYISLLEGSQTYQGEVINVVTNTITVDSPLDYTFTTAATVRRTTIELNIDGSSTAQTYNIVPNVSQVWDVVSMIFAIEDEVIMDTAKFGGITALTNGVIVRKKQNGNYNNIFTIKTNGEFELCNGVVNYQAKAPSGVYGIISKHTFGGQENFGVVIRLDGSKGEELQIIIQDNLSALSSFRASTQLHEVQN